MFLLLTPALSTNQLVSLQGRVLQSGSPATSGNIAVTIWSAVDNGTLLYSDNFANAVNDGFFDLMLGASSELNLTYGQFYYLDVSINGEDANWTAPSGGTVNRIQFQSQNGQIPPAQVQFNAVNSSHIQNDAVTASKIAPNSINASHILDNIITAAKIVNDAITSAKIAPAAVNSSHLNSAGTYYMGKLGIGTTGPSADLEIKSSSQIGALNITNGAGYPVLFVNASSQVVGIGTTGPQAKLEVAGNENWLRTSNVYYSPSVYGGSSGVNFKTVTGSGFSVYGGMLLTGVDDASNYADLHFSASTALTKTAAGAPTGSQLVIKGNTGNVGIGTVNPTTKLEVSGDLNVTGYIKSGCPSDMVSVGNRAFCIDKYESSAASGSVGHYSGNDTTLVAGSTSGAAPQASVTWFQAAVACANAGKRLCTNQEWTVACLGTPDTTTCNINSQGTPLNTGSLSNCKSRWGAYDMVGNVWEWVADWGQAGGISTTYTDGSYVAAWPGYGDGADGTWNINGRAYANAYGSGWTTGLPGAFFRGGYWGSGANAGCFAVDLNNAPSSVSAGVGFRCCK